MKVLYVLPKTYWGGGLQMNRLTLFQELVKLPEIDFAVCVLEFSGGTSERIKQLGVPEFFLNKKARFTHLGTSLALRKVLKEFDPDIIHTANIDADMHGYIASRMHRRSKLIVEEIGSAQERSRIMRRLCRHVYSRADGVLCVSPDIHQDMIDLQRVTRPDVKITYNPVNPEHLANTEMTPSELRQKHGLADSDFVFGIIARLIDFKGHAYLLDAFQRVNESNDQTKLVIVGSGPLMEPLRQDANSRGIAESVVFTDAVTNVGDYLSMMDVFVHPSTKEPFGISIIEAMYKKLLVITTDVGGPADYVDHDKTGILVPPFDADAIEAEMKRAMAMSASRRQEIGDAARETVLKRFLPEQYAKSMINVYRDVLAANTRQQAA